MKTFAPGEMLVVTNYMTVFHEVGDDYFGSSTLEPNMMFMIIGHQFDRSRSYHGQHLLYVMYRGQFGYLKFSEISDLFSCVTVIKP